MGQRLRASAPSENADKVTQEARTDRLPENTCFAVQSTGQKDTQEEKCSGQSNGVNTEETEYTFLVQFLQKVNNKSECSD